MNVQQVVARRDIQEKAVRVRLRDADAASQEQIAGRTGMQVFEAIFAGELPPAPIGDTLDFVPIHIEPVAAVFQWRPPEGRIVGPDGKLYAHATTTCLIFDHPATTRESSHGQA